MSKSASGFIRTISLGDIVFAQLNFEMSFWGLRLIVNVSFALAGINGIIGWWGVDMFLFEFKFVGIVDLMMCMGGLFFSIFSVPPRFRWIVFRWVLHILYFSMQMKNYKTQWNIIRFLIQLFSITFIIRTYNKPFLTIITPSHISISYTLSSQLNHGNNN